MKILKIAFVGLVAFGGTMMTASATYANAFEERNVRMVEVDGNVSIDRPIAQDWRNRNKERVAVSLPVSDYMQAFEDAPEATFESREYWFNVSGSALQKGTLLKTTAPGAVIRVSGVDGLGKAQVLSPEKFFIGSKTAAEKSVPIVSEKMQQSQGAHDGALTEGAIAFKLSGDQAFGAIQLRADSSVNANAQYLVHVFEPNSQIKLTAKALSQTVFFGQTLQAKSALMTGDSEAHSDKVSATLLAPDGRRIALSNVQSAHHNHVSELIAYPVSEQPGLWEVEWKVQSNFDGLAVERHIRTAFSYGEKSAFVSGVISTQKVFRDDVVRIRVPVNVVKEGRFEVRAIASIVINGEHYPAQLLSTAQWLKPGQHTATLELNRKALRDQGGRGVVAVESVQLLDQTQMISLQQKNLTVFLPQRRWY